MSPAVGHEKATYNGTGPAKSSSFIIHSLQFGSIL